MPNDNKLYLCFEYCEFDLKKYMKSQQYSTPPPAPPRGGLELFACRSREGKGQRPAEPEAPLARARLPR